MQNPILPADEKERLQTLRELLILDTAPERRFDLLTQYAATLFEVPIALVSLVDENRQWFKSRQGIEATETPRSVSFCHHAILQHGTLVINDTLEDPRFQNNPLVTGEPGIRFYAGAPLRMNNGHLVGTLCIIDRKPRQLDAAQLAELEELSRIVALELQGIAATDQFLQSHPNCG